MYRLIEKLHLERYLNSRLILAIDLVVSGVASLCALVLVRLLLPPLSNISKFALLWIGCAVVYSFITFFLLKTYRSVIRHSTLREIAKFVVAVIGKEFLLGLTILLYPPTPLFGMHMLALLLFAAAAALFQWGFPWAAANIPFLQQMSNFVAAS